MTLKSQELAGMVSGGTSYTACLGSPWPEDIPPLEGQFVCTAALSAKGALFVQTCRRITGFYTAFPPESDPKGLHEFGAFRIGGTNV